MLFRSNLYNNNINKQIKNDNNCSENNINNNINKTNKIIAEKFSQTLNKDNNLTKQEFNNIKNTLLKLNINGLGSIFTNEGLRSSNRIIQNNKIKNNTCVYAYITKDQTISLKDALSGPRRKEWIDAINKELQSHRILGTWEICEVKPNQRVLGTKFVLRPKFDEKGNEIKLKARLVILGYVQLYGIDYEDTFAPVTKLTSFRIFLNIANQFNMVMFQLDVVTAFLNGDLPEEIYIDFPFGVDIETELNYLPNNHYLRKLYEIDPSRIKLKVKRSIYGLKQAARYWYDKINAFLHKIGYKATTSDPCIYHSVSNYYKGIIALYVDDLIIASTNKNELSNIVNQICTEYKMNIKGEPNFMLGIKITRDKENNVLQIDQIQAIKDLLKQYKLNDIINDPRGIKRPYVKTEHLPTYPYNKLNKSMSPTTDKEKQFMLQTAKKYRSLVGSLMYIMVATRPDIAFAVSNLSKYVSNPGWLHWKAAIHCLKYLKGTIDLKISYKKSFTIPLTLTAFYDSDWAGCHDSRRSQSGGLLLLGNSPIAWISQQQSNCALSSAEAELNSLVITVKEIIWIRKLLHELKIFQNKPTILYGDNTSSMIIAKDQPINKRTKHIDLYYNFHFLYVQFTLFFSQ